MVSPETEDTPPRADPPSRVISVRGPDERGALVQLAARWAEKYAPLRGDDERAALERFRTAHDYVDDVIHGITPETDPS